MHVGFFIFFFYLSLTFYCWTYQSNPLGSICLQIGKCLPQIMSIVFEANFSYAYPASLKVNL